MDFYLASTTDPLFAVYETNGICHPVFEEKYGKIELPFNASMQKIEDQESILALTKYLNPYESNKKRIYMAGPLFNEGDRYTNQVNSDALREAGYTTFLPQEIVITTQSSPLVKAACFYMDFKAIKLSDVVLANCNGIEIDSGTAAEIGLAYGWNKKLILYKSDVRCYFNSEYKLNNFVGGLVDNKVCTTLAQVKSALQSL